MQHKGKVGLAAALIAGSLIAGSAPADAFVIPGTPGKDVHFGADNDNANNPFIQPPGVNAKQHMDNTDVLFGRDNDDLLIGKLGDDVLLGGKGHDILVGGPEAFSAPNSDVIMGEEGNDINIWAPGDGSDAFLGGHGYDTMIFAPFLTNSDGSLKLVHKRGRQIPQVKIDGAPQFSCTILKVPTEENLGFDFLVRFNVNGSPAVTVRQSDVESVLCPSPNKGEFLRADLTAEHPEFKPVRLTHVGGVTGAILNPAS